VEEEHEASVNFEGRSRGLCKRVFDDLVDEITGILVHSVLQEV
jgi:hypothetical protein